MRRTRLSGRAAVAASLVAIVVAALGIGGCRSYLASRSTRVGRAVASPAPSQSVPEPAAEASSDAVQALAGAPSASAGPAQPKPPANADQVTLDAGRCGQAPRPVPASGVSRQPEQFGAVGDGNADDTAAVQSALDALGAGDTLVLAAGKRYRHTAVLKIRKAGSRVSGPGTLLATNEQQSSVWIDADNVTLTGGVNLVMGSTTKRWDAYEQMKLRLAPHVGAVVDGVKINGSAAGGVYIGEASYFTLTDVEVKGTRADGIHMTGGSSCGKVIRPRVDGVGDDGVAVVSYGPDPKGLVHDIVVESPTVTSNTWGRGLSVVGGEHVTYRNVNVTGSNAAAVYISCEGDPYNTFSPRDIRVLGGTLTNSNVNSATDHGAVLFYSARKGYAIDDVVVDGLHINQTRASASWQVAATGDGGFSNIRVTNLAVTGGPARVFTAGTAGAAIQTSGWTYNGAAYAAR